MPEPTTIRVAQKDYWRIQDQRTKLTVLYPEFDDSQFVTWLAKEFEVDLSTGYRIAISVR